MPCLIALVLLGMPRVAVAAVWLFSTAIHSAFPNLLWPVLGFLFAPLTLLAWTWSMHEFAAIEGLGLAAVIVAALFDLGLLRASRRR